MKFQIQMYIIILIKTVLRMILSSKQNKIIESVKWKNIIVGDLLYIKKDEAIPADIVILSSSN